MSDIYDDYRRMCVQWDEIVPQPFSDKTRRMMCRAVLQEYLGERAVFRFRQPMPYLRFHADMLMFPTPGRSCSLQSFEP